MSRGLNPDDAPRRAVLAIAGGKGGTGTTTTACATAWTTSETTLLVDGDRRVPDATRRAGAVPGWPDAVSAGEPDRRLDEYTSVVEPTADAGQPTCRLVSAPASRQPPARLDSLLRLCRRAEPRAIIDCPSGADNRRLFSLADRVLVTTQPTEPAVRNARKTVRRARAADTPVVGCVVVRRGPTEVSPADALGPPVLARLPWVESAPLAARPVRAACRKLARTVFDEQPSEIELRDATPLGSEHRS